MRKSAYTDQPKGCRFSTNTARRPVPVDLDALSVHGTRAQRRYATKELKRMHKKFGDVLGD